VVYITNSGRMWLAGMVVSLAIFGLVFFTVIKPSTDTANQAVKSGMQQTEHVLSQAQKQIAGSGSQTGAATGQAGQALSKAQKLGSCLVAAGTDPTKVQACESRYSH
jgi:hypothetical protein